jgi:hypothetical protein
VNSHTARLRVLLLATAVMRLSKPTLQFQPPVLVEADDAPYPLSKCVAHAHPYGWTSERLLSSCSLRLGRTGEDQPTMTSSNVQNAFSLSPGLNLPRAFGYSTCPPFDSHQHTPTDSPLTARNSILPDSNIYVGETFCSYISLYNHTQSDLHLVGLRVAFLSLPALSTCASPAARRRRNSTRRSSRTCSSTKPQPGYGLMSQLVEQSLSTSPTPHSQYSG